jgi:hypothetical protein
MATFFQKISKFTRGIRFRLSLVYSAVFGACLLIISLFITGEYLNFARDEYDQFLRNFAIDLSQHVQLGDDGKKVELDIPLFEQIKYFPFVIQNTIVTVRHLDGGVLYTNRKQDLIPFDQRIAQQKNYSHRFFGFSLQDGTEMRAVNLKFVHREVPMVLQIGSTVEGLAVQRERHLLYLMLIIPLSMLVTALTSVMVAGKALAPVRATINRMEKILSSDSYQPLPVPNTHDEIADLARTYNTMLERVTKTLEAQDQFVSHASHQLNTPLAIMRGELEVLLSKPRSQEETLQFHQSLAQELERMGQLVRDMLLVSRVEAGRAHFRFISLRLDDIVTDTVARLAGRARSKKLTLKMELDPELLEDDLTLNFTGERQLLTVMCENLIENAIKYSPEGAQVKVSLKWENEVRLEVSDQGPGIPQNAWDRMMRAERFFRGEHTTNVSGSGLGLYLVGRIADYHNCKLELPATQSGATVRVRFPTDPVAGAPDVG